MTHVNTILSIALAAVLIAGATMPRSASASNDALLGAVGGLIGGKLLADHQQKKRNEAYQQGAEDQYVAQQQYAQQQQQQAAQSPEARLARLKNLKDQGLISESDYNTQKAAIVSSL
jgi:membrane protease subunit (stomatin/prohibitin family)